MKYDFTTVNRPAWKGFAGTRRTGTRRSFSPDPPKEGFDIIPMWVADMNFPTVPTVQEAMAERIGHPALDTFLRPMIILMQLSGGRKGETG